VALYTDLASLSQTAGANAADGTTDAPSTIDQQLNSLASFIAQLRDGDGFSTGLGNVGNVGQCRLAKSGANLVLSPFQGNGLTINGVTYQIPSGGVSLASTSLAPLTLYYIYAYMNGTTMTLEASTTGHGVDVTSGVEVKSADASRTLVGMARTTTPVAWVDTTTQRFVASWFNRRKTRMVYSNLAAFPYGSGTFTNINTFLNLEFLSWGDESVQVRMLVPISHTSANGIVQTGVALDSFNTPNVDTYDIWQAYAINANGAAKFFGESLPSEGYHFFSPCGATSGANASWGIGGTFSATVTV
jgi:hypothetical protein